MQNLGSLSGPLGCAKVVVQAMQAHGVHCMFVCVYIYIYIYIYISSVDAKTGELVGALGAQGLGLDKFVHKCYYIYIYIYTHTYIHTYKQTRTRV